MTRVTFLLAPIAFNILIVSSALAADAKMSDFERGYKAGLAAQQGRVVIADGYNYNFDARTKLAGTCSGGELKQIVCLDYDSLYDRGSIRKQMCAGICFTSE